MKRNKGTTITIALTQLFLNSSKSPSIASSSTNNKQTSSICDSSSDNEQSNEQLNNNEAKQLAKKYRERHGTIKELIETERNYLNEMTLCYDIFMNDSNQNVCINISILCCP